ncbi:MAG: hypothetical protein BA863_11875 [Desulfovibrio sp. S3730MH75]|nr:MAG: hypothetical protein BA863_11875 [Desulfovibrio sp. S3730MH75]
MQKDMHYYGTYAIARAAGILPEAAQIIASASQFVDDNAVKEVINFSDNASLYSRPTAHKCENIKNTDDDDQRVVWVPFHFLPGGEGSTFEEKIKCIKDSEIANKMVANHINKTDKKFYIALLGVTAHVYADTFSHYGFSGLSSDINNINIPTIELAPDSSNFFDETITKVKAGTAEILSGFLGHGGVATYPDWPFLEWEFDYENGEKNSRKNLDTFMEGSKALHNMFRTACELHSDLYQGSHRSFEQIEASLKDILSFNGDEEERIENWKEKFQDDSANFTETKEVILEYLGDKWNAERKAMDDNSHSSIVENSPLFNFYKAASYHRHYVLRDLLPDHGIVVS